ncbi:S-adenosyl-L-methionine-dependent methyltransferase, partial [Ascobolus immersus RN42]
DYSDFSDSDLLALGSRTYHPSYLLPTDQDEEIRLKFAHDIWRDHLGGKPFLSTLPPADGEFKILDLGSGFGHWALEVAALYPDADVLGFDLNAVQIEVDEVPKNVEFAVGDLEEPRWGVGRGFGFVHGRGLGGSIEDWGSVLRRAWRHLTPHGHLELAERALTPTSLDATYKPNTALHTYYTHLTTALQRLNRTVGITEELKNLVLEAGFEDVQEVRGFIPVRVGADMTEMEKFVLFVVLESFEAWGLRAFVEVLGMGVDEARAVCENAAKELREGGVRIGFRTVVVTARKP